jgi:hypothetical protein
LAPAKGDLIKRNGAKSPILGISSADHRRFIICSSSRAARFSASLLASRRHRFG